MREGERFVGVNHVDDIVVFEWGGALDEFCNGVPLDIAKEDGVLFVDRADGVNHRFGGKGPVVSLYGTLAHVGFIQEFKEDVFAGVFGIVGCHMLPGFSHHLDVLVVLGAGRVVAIVVFVVVDYEGHVVLAGPFHEGIEHSEERAVIECEGNRTGGVLDKGVTVGGVQVKVNGQAEALDSVIGQKLHVGFVKYKALELAIGIFKPVGEVDALVQVLHCLFLQIGVERDFVKGEGNFRNDRIVDGHVGFVFFDFTGILQVDVVKEDGVCYDLALGSLSLETDGLDVLGVKCHFLAPAALDQVLEADNCLSPGARCFDLGEVNVIVFHIGNFDVHFVCATLVPVGDTAETAVGVVFGNLNTPTHIRVVFVFTLVERVVDLKCVVGTVVHFARNNFVGIAQRGRNDRGTAVGIVVVSVPVIVDGGRIVVAIFEVIDEQALACGERDRTFGRKGRRIRSRVGHRRIGRCCARIRRNRGGIRRSRNRCNGRIVGGDYRFIRSSGFAGVVAASAQEKECCSRKC